jgi:hypothetical protein
VGGGAGRSCEPRCEYLKRKKPGGATRRAIIPSPYDRLRLAKGSNPSSNALSARKNITMARIVEPNSQSNGREHVSAKLSWLDLVMDHPDTTTVDLAVAMVIARKTRREYGDAAIDQNFIADKAKIKKRSVVSSIARLSRLGLLDVVKGHGRYANNCYRMSLSKCTSCTLNDVDDVASDVSKCKKRPVEVQNLHSQSAPDARKYKTSYIPRYLTSDEERESAAVAAPPTPVDQEGTGLVIGITTSSPSFDAPQVGNIISYRHHAQKRRDRVDDTKPANTSRAGATLVPDKLEKADRDYALAHGMDIDAASKLANRFINHYRNVASDRSKHEPLFISVSVSSR